MDQTLRTEFQLGDLTLRAWREDDIDAAFAIVQQNRKHLQTFMRWMTPEYSIEDARKFICNAIKDRLDRKTLGLALLSDDKLIGSTGFNRLDWGSRVCEIGYWIDHRHEGKGSITTACKVMIEYAFDELQMNRVEIRCSAENLRSAAVPERLGFKKEGLLRRSEVLNGNNHDFLIFGLLADDLRLW
ncbi:MAG TPA: GNAT family N-acetyltransferase [Pyrinomonadaceae bacterium]|nr:GNAT family N-acetyltransferase [Pyrinomonadaceae bacterium]